MSLGNGSFLSRVAFLMRNVFNYEVTFAIYTSCERQTEYGSNKWPRLETKLHIWIQYPGKTTNGLGYQACFATTEMRPDKDAI